MPDRMVDMVLYAVQVVNDKGSNAMCFMIAGRSVLMEHWQCLSGEPVASLYTFILSKIVRVYYP